MLRSYPVREHYKNSNARLLVMQKRPRQSAYVTRSARPLIALDQVVISPAASRCVALVMLSATKAWDLKMDRETRFIPTDIESTVCWRCREKARLIRREPLPANVMGEMLTFKCEKCGKESKTIVQG